MDKYLVSFAVALLILECGWLLNDLNVIDVPGLHHSHENNSTGPVLGEITLIKKEVKKRAASSLVWESTYDEQDLYAYDSVLTLDQSAAEVSLGGNSHITLQENTLVTIEPPSSDNLAGPVRLHFKQGALRANFDNPSESIDVGDYVLEAKEKTQVTIRSSGPGHFEIETHSGSASVGGKTVKAGEALSIGDKKVSEVRVALEIKWDAPSDGTRIYTHANSADVPLSWQGQVIDAVISETELKKSETVPLVLGTDGHQKLPLARGNYIVQLRNNEKTTFARNIAVWEAPKIHLIAPLTRQRIKFGKTVELLWTQNSEVKTFEWQVATDSTFKNVVQKGATSENKAEVGNLPLGEFYWRVEGKDDQGYQIPEMYFNTFNIVVNPLEAPKLKAPSVLPDEGFNIWKWILPEAEADEVAPHKLPKHYKAVFQWEAVPGADSYSIEICDTPDFREPVVKETIREPRYRWKDFKLGEYYWRVAAQSDSGELGLFSETAVADLHSIPAKPIVPVSMAQAKALQEKPKPTPTPFPTPTPTPFPTPIPTPIPTPKPTPVPTPRPPPKELHSEWIFEARGGGHGIVSLYKGADYQATQLGGTVGDYRLLVTPPPQKSNWRFEGEFQSESLKISNSNASPFQDTLQVHTFRVTALNENPEQGETSLGFSAHNQNFMFQRADLENLSLSTPWSLGPFLDWRYVRPSTETEYRLGAYFGQMSTLEARASRTGVFNISRALDFTATIEGKLTAGATTQGWFGADGTIYILLGVRWK